MNIKSLLILKKAIIIFVRNPVLGQVKTRLAKTIGDHKALLVYKQLLAHTQAIAAAVDAARFVFYADDINTDDGWQNESFEKFLQQGASLGARMQHAFQQLMEAGYGRVIIIGSDCYELDAAIINEAFNQLENHDIVIGPCYDGGYYLLGMKQLIAELFEDKAWSSSTVLQDTINDVTTLALSHKLLPVLNDIDDEDDLKKSKLKLAF